MDSGTIEGDGSPREENDVDPQVTLAPEELSQADFSSAVLSRLAQQGPDSTRYQVKGEVARGGMGAVLRVWDEGLRRHLAMKVMLGQGVPDEHGDTPSVDARTLARFLEEAQVTGQLDHPGIVPVHELGLDAEGRVYFTMKLVKGKTLRQVFDELEQGEGGWTQTRVLGLIQKVCDAMSYAHAKGVIHRDLKPANVMVGKYGEVYVMDWGLARILGRDDERDLRPRAEQPAMMTSEVRSERQDRSGSTPDMSLMTMDGDVVGTPAYMPPEQARGDLPAMGPHSDVYAVGAMLYQLLAGHMPYVPRDARLNNYAVWQRVQEGPPRPLHEVAHDAPAEIAAICERAMAREPSERYADMAALAGDLRAYVEGRVVSAYETGAWAETKKWVRRNKSLAASLAAVLVLLVVGLLSTWLLKAQADAKTAEVLRLSDMKALQELVEEANTLWPAHPDKTPQFESWLGRAHTLVGNLPTHRETLAAMRERALPRSTEDMERDRRSHPRYPELASLERELATIRRAHAVHRGLSDTGSGELDEHEIRGLAWRLVAPGRTVFGHEARALSEARRRMRGGYAPWLDLKLLPWALFANGRFDQASAAAEEAVRHAPDIPPYSYNPAALEQLLESLRRLEVSIEGTEVVEQEITALEAELGFRRTWRFSTREEQWQDDLLAELVVAIEGLQAGLLDDHAITEQHGWSVPRRLAFAREMESDFAAGGKYHQAWGEALPAIHEAYPGLDLQPQMGLVPIGPDPQSNLWEFAHLMTGEPPQRGVDGTLIPTEEMGVVLVLLPGGEVRMGAQSWDPSGPNYDPQARGDESPVHEVELSAFFLSKYEVTKAQWRRFMGSDPSNMPARGIGPISRVDYWTCAEVCDRLGLALPSESQWEYGARGGTGTVWWTGDDMRSLQGAANLADRYARDHLGGAGEYRTVVVEAPFMDWLDDRHTLVAPVGTYRPNAFGLHDVHGNVEEWCTFSRGTGMPYSPGRRRDVPMDPGGGVALHRGGSFTSSAFLARSACRGRNVPEYVEQNLGFRPARAIED